MRNHSAFIMSTDRKLVAICKLCGTQWVVRAEGVDTEGCPFCGAGPNAITTKAEDD